MQKGTQLEYKVNWFKRDSSAGRAVARLVFEVEQVTDSAGSCWSRIIKKGYSHFNEKDHYQRKIVLQCDSRSLYFPYDFYTADTIFTKDIYPKVWDKDQYGYVMAYTPLTDAITYIVPLVMDCIVGLPEGKKQFVQKVKRGYTNVVICKGIPDGHTITINSIALERKEWITTTAGTFFCYKFCVEYEGEYGPYQDWLYLHPEVGLVKLEEGHRSVELVNIRK